MKFIVMIMITPTCMGLSLSYIIIIIIIVIITIKTNDHHADHLHGAELDIVFLLLLPPLPSPCFAHRVEDAIVRPQNWSEMHDYNH